MESTGDLVNKQIKGHNHGQVPKDIMHNIGFETATI